VDFFLVPSIKTATISYRPPEAGDTLFEALEFGVVSAEDPGGLDENLAVHVADAGLAGNGLADVGAAGPHLPRERHENPASRGHGPLLFGHSRAGPATGSESRDLRILRSSERASAAREAESRKPKAGKGGLATPKPEGRRRAG